MRLGQFIKELQRLQDKYGSNVPVTLNDAEEDIRSIVAYDEFGKDAEITKEPVIDIGILS